MIRSAELKDIPAIKALLAQILAVHHVGRPDLFKPIGQKFTDEEIAKLITGSETPVFVYEDENGKVIAHCFCQSRGTPDDSCTYARSTLYIDDVCVDEAARGRHIGTALYEYAREYAKEHGYYNIILHAWECNPAAVAFYKSLGMQVRSYTMEDMLQSD